MLWISLLIVTSSCGHVPVYDKRVCGDLGEDGAHCNHTLLTQPENFDKATWDKMRVGWMCMDSTSFNDTETALDQLCNNSKKCDYKTKEAVKTIKLHLQEIRKVAVRLKYNLNEDVDRD